MLKNMRIGTRLASTFAAVLLVFIATLLLVGMSITHLMQGIKQIKEETLPFVLVVDEMDTNRSEVQQFLTDVSATHNRDGYKEAEEAAKRFLDGVEKYKKMFQQENDTASLKKIETIEADFNNFYASGKLMAETYVTKGLNAGNTKMEGFDKDSEALSGELTKFREQQVAEANNITASTLSAAQSIITQMIVASVLATLLAAFFAFWITRSITRPLNEAVNMAKQLAEGDLTAQIKAVSKDETGQLLAAMQSMTDKIKALIADTDNLIEAAANGKLDARADTGKHQGDFRKLVQGINSTLDGITIPLNEVISVLGEMEKGDLTSKVNGDYKGQLKDFKDSVNNTINKISEVLGEVMVSANALSSASEEVNATAQSLSQAASEQAASVEETSASVEQMSASVNQNTDNAQVTDSMASQAAKQAVEGGEAVQQTVAAMKQIAAKIGIIDDIAYQTNLLALNAAIEAHVPAMPGVASPWWRRKCASWPNAARWQRSKSAAWPEAAWNWPNVPASC